MEVFEIEGGKPLTGTIPVSGSKNAATPIIAATLLTDQECVLTNVPRIEDVFRMLEILESMGSVVVWRDEHTLAIRSENIDPSKMDVSIVKKLRSSILLLGALSGRLPEFTLYRPGGCVIGARPVETHCKALAQLGVSVTATEKGYTIDARGRRPGRVVLREFSVTATEIAMILAAALPGETTIRNAAAEPHVENLGLFLKNLGAQVAGLGTHTVTIIGGAPLGGASIEIFPDHNEAATFLILGAATGSVLTAQYARRDHLDMVLERLGEFGVTFSDTADGITVHPAERLRAVSKLETQVYPGVPTDVQAPFGVLATQADGDSLIFDTLYENRFNYVSELEKMGANATVLNPHQVLFRGPSALRGTTIRSYDLRAGAALIIAALCATGTTVIEDIYQVDRGYERIEERLAALGARIRRVSRADRGI